MEKISALSFWHALVSLPRRLPRILRWTLLGGFFVLALAFLLLRHFGAPQIAAHRLEIEQVLSNQLGLSVRIARLEGNWDGLRPQLSIGQLQMLDEAGRVALELPQVELELAWSSLLYLSPRLHRLELLRPELALRREADGSLRVAGLKVDSSGESSDFSDFVLAQDQILIRDARIEWTDALRGAPPLALDKFSLRLENSGRRHRFALRASPPAEYSASLDLRADLRGKSLARLESWSGQVYAALDQADLAVWQKWVDYPLSLPSGRGGVRAWLGLSSGEVSSLRADVALRDVNVRLSEELPQLELAALQGRVDVQHEDGRFDFSAEDLTLAAQDGLAIGPTRLKLQYQSAQPGRPAQGEFSTGKQDVAVLAQLASFLPLPEQARSRLALADPAGQVSELQLGWQGDAEKPEHFKLKASVENLRLHPLGEFPGFEGLSGQISGTEQSGDFSLQIKSGGLYLPGIMHEPFMPLQRADLRGRWSHERAAAQDAEQLTVRLARGQLSNSDVSAAVSGYWQARAEGPGFLDLKAQAAQARLDAVWRYIPAVAPHDVVSWLRTLTAGRGEKLRFQLSGDLRDFPFNQRPGVFHLEAKLRDATIENFAPGWPGMHALQGSFELDRQRITILAESGRYGAASARAVKVEIPDLMADGKQVLTVEGKASGPTTAFLDYVNASYLHQLAGSFTSQVRAQGAGNLSLAIEVPLHDSNHTRVKGEYRFDAPALRLTPALPEFQGVRATLAFNERGVSLPAASAQFLGRKVEATGVTETDGSLRFDARGNMSVSGLRQLVANPAWDYLSGESPVVVLLRVRGGLLDVQADSQLKGIVSDLPAPFAKDAGESWPLRFGLRQTQAGASATQQHWQVRVDQRVDVRWSELCPVGAACEMQSGALAVGEAAALPAKGWRFSGIVPSLDAGRWQPVVDDIISGFGSGTSGLEVAVAARVGELSLAGFRFQQVEGKALRRGSDWNLLLAGPDLAGELSWSELAEGRLHARLSRLVLQQPEAGLSEPTEAPLSAATQQRSLPALDVVAEEFQLRKIKLGRLALQAKNEGAIWKLSNITLKTPEMELKGSGEWRRGGAAPGTYLDFYLHSDDVGLTLGRFGHADMVAGGIADFSGKADWRGMPTSPHFASMTGQLNLEARDGQFREMEPGAGRLLGILSLQSLPRRLTLDFRDVFSDGFAFNRIAGDMNVSAGVLHTNDLEVRGPAARVFITGTTDLGREQHDLKLKVQPTLSESVAVGALAIGALNPIVGAATYLAQKILRDPVEKVFSYEYLVRGSWSEPKVEKAGAASVPASAPASTPPSPEGAQ